MIILILPYGDVTTILSADVLDRAAFQDDRADFMPKNGIMLAKVKF